MDVYLIPLGPDRHALYCEPPSHAPEADAAPSSWLGRARATFHRAVAEGEDEVRHPDGAPGAPDGKRPGRLRRAVTRKVAQIVAEQRLLWHLRREEHARLIHPDDLDPARALEESRAILTTDHDRHVRGLVVNGLLLVVSAPLTVVPGPNVLAYYFTFRTVGHFLSKRGADQGLARVAWTCCPSSELADLRGALRLDRRERMPRIEAIAHALGLERLPHFVAGVAEQA